MATNHRKNSERFKNYCSSKFDFVSFQIPNLKTVQCTINNIHEEWRHQGFTFLKIFEVWKISLCDWKFQLFFITVCIYFTIMKGIPIFFFNYGFSLVKLRIWIYFKLNFNLKVLSPIQFRRIEIKLRRTTEQNDYFHGFK